MNIVSFFGAKHGVGTSTLAAVLLAQSDSSRILISHDVEDTLALLGQPQWDTNEHLIHNISYDEYVPSEQTVLAFDPHRALRQSHLRTAKFSSGAELIIMDWGTVEPTIGRRVLVTDNSYVALRRAVKMPHSADMVVLVRDHVRALTVADVEHAVGRPVIAVDRDSSLMRACDAGLLVTRVPHHIIRALVALNTAEEAPTC